MTMTNNLVSSKDTRRRLRADSTVPEKRIWRLLRDRRLEGYKFRRQHGIGAYIVDFYCPEIRLVVEIDGDSHFTPEAQQYDQRRTAYLRSCGMDVIRFTNDDVGWKPEVVVDQIYQYIETHYPERRPHPVPLLLKERGT